MASGVVFLPSYHEAIRDLPDAERLSLYDAIVRYGLYGEIIELPPMQKAMFSLIKPTIDSSQNRYRAAKENGSLGGRPKKPERIQTGNQTKNQTENQDIDLEKNKDSDKETERESRERTARHREDDFEKRRAEALRRLAEAL